MVQLKMLLTGGAFFSTVSLSTAFCSTNRWNQNAVSQKQRKHHLAPLCSSVQNPMRDPQSDNEDGEWHPMDPAHTTPQFMGAIWNLIAHGNSLVKGESYTVVFPQMEEKFTPRYLNLAMAHLDACKDVCDNFGISTTLQPYTRKGRVVGFTVKSYKNPDKDPDSMEFAYDPFWDDGDDWSYDGVDEEEGGVIEDKYPEIVNKIPDDDEAIIDISKKWVGKICSDMGICPFASTAEQAGLPIGPVFYTVDRATTFEDMYARYWKEVVRIEKQPEKDISTTLLVAPEFCFDNVEIFETFSTTLTQPLAALGIEDLLQLVFFHPQWSFRDGGERGSTGMAANYARRSPWPMINILRTKQVRAAQKGIPTGLVYKQNEKTLAGIGVDQLETMLRMRDWEPIKDLKVNRREMEALRVAQDFQQSGTVKNDDQMFANDATPAAAKVDKKQVEQGNLVNVVLQALDKRLGKTSGTRERLSGPETSATMMAADFLLQALKSEAEGMEQVVDPRISSAKSAIMADFEPDEEVGDRGDAVTDVLFGRSGILESKDDDSEDPYAAGANPANFY